MKAIIYCTVKTEIEVPEGTLTRGARDIICSMTPEEIVTGAELDTTQSIEVHLPHASTSFKYGN